ncbi:hypothetical protein [Mucilaginibacter segetis]|uniref:Uncharacterized protein n=1 Tax=Mucilaginibacter segetis TaxID=2793071 RepID=A0A934PRW3_9SPHI|nr:hypothetical protein [Mucilaginibacter segetis]MBK0379653.1 hypothetical protein [Mucilaginibacter segetis]
MKKLYIFLLVSAAFFSCKKENTGNGIIIDPPAAKIISQDTLTSGQFLGLTIGQTSTGIYATIQANKTTQQISYLNVVGNVFTQLDSLKDRLPLYTSILLDEQKGTGTGIQIYFENDKVKSIWTNDGIQLNKWPVGNSTNATIAVNDQISTIYQKLVNIKKIASYANKFERLSIFSKDINKVYDPAMSASTQWYFTSVINSRQYNVVQLNFNANTLTSIYSTIYESE